MHNLGFWFWLELEFLRQFCAAQADLKFVIWLRMTLYSRFSCLACQVLVLRACTPHIADTTLEEHIVTNVSAHP